MAKKEVTEAEKLLKELHNIPKIIEALKLDVERTRHSLIASPKWSDIRVIGGVKQTQEDKNISIIDLTDYNQSEINRLLNRKQEIIDLINKLDAEHSLLLIRAFVLEEFPSDCIGKFYTERKFYMIKKVAIENLNKLLSNEVI
ncbi:DUF1492 domain-containing protein [Streptococcus iniae]|uniref:DUF1492 domain-containing protein n=1 Tax=Streptococcus iniae TaxID=1346 RepID=UPI0003156DF9|nr:DUF1492 domain-containing protein [Streptococcus iniae]ESR08738.1 hypothetical protein IUSA1_10835 [Streptococcus iniae IUSA1]OHX27977.1 hypothetical protein BKX95_02105 [Streptococcus iniae]QBX08509.1 hypothetical protein JavanS276_0006 [Streptococcus satellite phage Javan276]RLV26821.1 DUF1492 domain-containing protein [Streptococcus iniae]